MNSQANELLLEWYAERCHQLADESPMGGVRRVLRLLATDLKIEAKRLAEASAITILEGGLCRIDLFVLAMGLGESHRKDNANCDRDRPELPAPVWAIPSHHKRQHLHSKDSIPEWDGRN
ncbi:MAG: hypothetical protein NTV56_19025 [Alphaproteobacteria bacterium]|nr:hypothetical protein [Alphaproteobacteria bacterium]